MIDKPKVGEKVFVKYNDTAPEVAETTVEKVGRKYFILKCESSWWPLEFDIETPVSGYWTASSRARHNKICYRSEDALKAKFENDALKAEAHKLREQLTKAFDYWNRDKCTLDQLRRIKAIVDEGKENQ